MTDNTQELDEILRDNLTHDEYQYTDKPHRMKQAILDWHNKQIEAVLDRLSVASSYTDKQFSENPQLCLGKRDVQLAIEAERNKMEAEL